MNCLASVVTPNELVRDGRLPAPDARMTYERKAVILRAIHDGIVTPDNILIFYQMSQEELDIWEQRFQKRGKNGLRSTYASHYRSEERFGQ